MKKFIITIGCAIAAQVTVNAQESLAFRIAVELERIHQQQETQDIYWEKRGYIREGNVYRNIYSNQGRNTANIREQNEWEE